MGERQTEMTFGTCAEWLWPKGNIDRCQLDQCFSKAKSWKSVNSRSLRSKAMCALLNKALQQLQCDLRLPDPGLIQALKC